jgi:hypothetical protein
MKTVELKAALETMQKDYENRDVLLSMIPEIDPWSGNPKRAICEQMMNNMLLMGQGKLSLPAGALEAGDTITSGIPSTTGQIMPIISRFFPEEIAFDLVTTQPMTGPTGLAMWLNEKYGTVDADGTPETNNVGDRLDAVKNREYSTETTEGEDASKIYIDLSSVTLDTKCKKLKAHVTPQAMQDYSAVAGIDSEAVLNGAIARALRREVGLQIIYQLVTYAAAGNVNWSSAAPSGSTVLNIQAHKRTLWEAVVDAQNLIYDAIYKMPNFIVTNPTNWGRLRKTLENFETNPALSGQPMSIRGRYLAGTTDDGVRCYVDPWFPSATKILVGYKGEAWQDAGAFYAPYIPLWWTPAFYDPDDGGKYKRLALTRYGKCASGTYNGTMVLDGNYFSTITISAS